MKKVLLAVGLAAVLATVAVAASAPPAIAAAPVTWSFDVTFDPSATLANGTPTWTGTVSGPASGSVEVNLLSARLAGQALHIGLEYAISAGSMSQTIELAGVFNEVTLRAVSNGRVTGGWLAGARVHQEAERIDSSTGRLVGSVRVMPATA